MSKEVVNDKNNAKEVSTKERLILAGLHLFSVHGFEATTTRMLAEKAGVNNASVYFHFGTKENLYFEVLNTVAGTIKAAFEPLREEIEEKRSLTRLNREQAWHYIETYVDLYLSIIRNPENSKILYLLLHEQLNPVHNHRPITEVACRDGEQLLVRLLFDYWQSENRPAAVIASRLVTSSLVALSEHPSFLRVGLGIDTNGDFPGEVWQIIRDYSLASLKAFRPA